MQHLASGVRKQIAGRPVRVGVGAATFSIVLPLSPRLLTTLAVLGRACDPDAAQVNPAGCRAAVAAGRTIVGGLDAVREEADGTLTEAEAVDEHELGAFLFVLGAKAYRLLDDAAAKLPRRTTAARRLSRPAPSRTPPAPRVPRARESRPGRRRRVTARAGPSGSRDDPDEADVTPARRRA